MRNTAALVVVQIAAVMVAGALGAGCTAISDFGRFRPDDSDAGAGMDGGGQDDAGQDDAGQADGGQADGGTGDAGADGGPPTCEPCGAGETCVDGICRCGSGDACGTGEACCDDVCTDIQGSLTACGGCGILCETLPGSTRSCIDGSCQHTCDAGFADCDAEPGCETDLSQAATCGSCTTACVGIEMCSPSGEGFVCTETCGGGLTACSGSCVDLDTSVTHCGACGASCSARANALVACAGSCTYTCESGFLDCDNDLAQPSGSNGCESSPQTYYLDADHDGYGVPSSVTTGCPGAPPPNYAATSGDCNDGNAAVYPGAAETCNDVDDDCDGFRDETFTLSGVSIGGSCSCGPGAAAGQVVCAGDGASARCEYPAEACNSVDDDCDGARDETFACTDGDTQTCTIATPLYNTTCVGSRACTTGSCTWSACAASSAETCDRSDQDCDDFTDENLLGVGTPYNLADMGSRARAAFDGTNEIVGIAYQSSSGLRVASVRLDGTYATTPITVSTETAISDFDIAHDGRHFVVAFASMTAQAARVARVNALTGAMSAVVDIGSGATAANGAIRITRVAALGRTVAAWTYNAIPGGTSRVFARVIDGDVTVGAITPGAGPERIVETFDGIVSHAIVSTGTNGVVIAASRVNHGGMPGSATVSEIELHAWALSGAPGAGLIIESDANVVERDLRLAVSVEDSRVGLLFRKENGSSNATYLRIFDLAGMTTTGPLMLGAGVGASDVAYAGDHAFGVVLNMGGTGAQIRRYRTLDGALVPGTTTVTTGFNDYLIGVRGGTHRYIGYRHSGSATPLAIQPHACL